MTAVIIRGPDLEDVTLDSEVFRGSDYQVNNRFYHREYPGSNSPPPGTLTWPNRTFLRNQLSIDGGITFISIPTTLEGLQEYFPSPQWSFLDDDPLNVYDDFSDYYYLFAPNPRGTWESRTLVSPTEPTTTLDTREGDQWFNPETGVLSIFTEDT